MTLSLFELPPGDSGLPARPGRPTDPDRPTSTHSVAPSRSTSRSSRPESPRVARPSRSERQKSTEKGARDAPRRDFRRFLVDFRVDFRGFSRLHRASDSTRSAKGRTSVFAGRRDTLEGSQTLRKNRKSTKIEETSLRRRFVNERREQKLDFFVAGRDSASILVASARSRTLSGALPGVSGCPWGLSGRSQGAPGTPQDAPETLPRRLRDALWRHGAPQEGLGTDFESILGAPGLLPASIFEGFS